MDPVTLLLLVAGFVALVGGGELLVRGAGHLARAVGISPLVVGLTVVAFGTSAPELAVGVTSALDGQPDIALGNVVGSNIANVLLVLGLAALVTPLLAPRRVVTRELPVMIAASFAFWLMALSGQIDRLEGLILVAGIVVYTVVLIRGSRRDAAAALVAAAAPDAGSAAAEAAPAVPDARSAAPDAAVERGRARRALAGNVALVGAGLVGLVLGAGWIVDGATAIATGLGIPEIVIGLTIVAVGTSLPEITTSVVAGLRGERDLAIGNVVGSCLFNILMVLGATALVSPSPVPVADGLLAVDVPLMVAAALACLPLFFTKLALSRREGALLLAYYAAYLAYLLLVATDPPAAAVFGSALIMVAVPLTGIVLVAIALRDRQRTRDAVAPS